MAGWMDDVEKNRTVVMSSIFLITRIYLMMNAGPKDKNPHPNPVSEIHICISANKTLGDAVTTACSCKDR
jgi:hypothetical protein